MFACTLTGNGGHARRTAGPVLVALVAATAVGGCGGGQKRQDADEPAGQFKVKVLEARFPERQKLAKRSEMRIVVKNVGDRTIPDLSVTVKSFDRKERDADEENRAVSAQPQLADPRSPVFIVNKSPVEYTQDLGAGESSLVDREVDPPRGTEASGSYVDTYSLGPARPGETKEFRWSVTASVAGPFKLRYRVNAGLDGRARALLAGGGTPAGDFSGTIEDRRFDADVDFEDGRTIVREGERIGPKPPDRSNGPNDD